MIIQESELEPSTLESDTQPKGKGEGNYFSVKFIFENILQKSLCILTGDTKVKPPCGFTFVSPLLKHSGYGPDENQNQTHYLQHRNHLQNQPLKIQFNGNIIDFMQ